MHASAYSQALLELEDQVAVKSNLGRCFYPRRVPRLVLTALVLASCLVVGLPTASAQAPDEKTELEAKRQFQIGLDLYNHGEFAEAAERFEESYKLSGRAKLLYNVYLAYRDAQNLPKAIEALRGFIEAEPDDERVPGLRVRLEIMEKSVAERGSTTPSGDGGQEGGADTTGTSSSSTADEGKQPTPGDSSKTLMLVGFITGGVGAAAAIGGVVTGILANGANRELDQLCGTDRVCEASTLGQATTLSSRIRTMSLVTDILLIGGGVTLAAGATLALLMLRKQSGSAPENDATAPAVSAGFMCGPGGCLATLQGRL